MVRRTRRGERRSSFILKKARILVKLQLQLTSLHTRVVSLEVWILQMLAWSIIMSYITWEMSSMVHSVLSDTRPHLSHTCPTRHLKVQIYEDTVRYMWGSIHHTERQRIRTATKFVGSSGGHSESGFCSSVTKVSNFILLQASHSLLKITTETLCLSITGEKYTVVFRQHMVTRSCSPSLPPCYVVRCGRLDGLLVRNTR
jgi:hypothetical protein